MIGRVRNPNWFSKDVRLCGYVTNLTMRAHMLQVLNYISHLDVVFEHDACTARAVCTATPIHNPACLPVPAKKKWLEFLYTEFETCFGSVGTDSKNISQIKR